MSQKTIVTVTCDVDGTEGAETVPFAFDGAAYEIDVCPAHAKDLREQFGQYVEHGRRVAGARQRPRSTAGRKASGDIRTWAKDHGLAVSERGRIPASVVEQYQAATG